MSAGEATMNRRDRDQLAQVAKMRARVAKSAIEQRESVLKMQVEDELQAMFETEDELAARAEEAANDIARRANTDLKDKLDELEVPERLRPMIGVAKAEQVVARGDSRATRRGSLRAIAQSRIKALGANAKVEIDRSCADTVTQLIAGGLSNDEAQRFLAAMPTIDQLMLAPSVAELESVHDEQRRERRALGGGAW